MLCIGWGVFSTNVIPVESVLLEFDEIHSQIDPFLSGVPDTYVYVYEYKKQRMWYVTLVQKNVLPLHSWSFIYVYTLITRNFGTLYFI